MNKAGSRFALAIAAAMLLHLTAVPGTARLPTPGMLVSIADRSDPHLPGGTVSYRLEVANFSTSAVADTMVETATPVGTTFDHVDAEHGTCTTPEPGASGPISCALGEIAAGEAVTIDFVFASHAAAGTKLVFDVAVASSSGLSLVHAEPTYVVNAGDPVLRWELPDIQPGGVFTPPKRLRVERAAQTGIVPTLPPLVAIIPGQEFHLYRSPEPGVQAMPENLFLTLPRTQTNTGAIEAEPGYFYAVAFSDARGEGALSNEVSFGRGEPTISGVTLVRSKLTVTGADFESGVEVTIDGLAFRHPASVSPDGSSVVAKGKLSNGMALKRYIKLRPVVFACFRNPGGGVTCLPIVTVVIGPG